MNPKPRQAFRLALRESDDGGGGASPRGRLWQPGRSFRAPEYVAQAERGAGDVRVASWNLHNCVGTDGRFGPARSVAVIAEPDADIVALQEADRRFGRHSGLLDLHALERATRLKPPHVLDHLPLTVLVRLGSTRHGLSPPQPV